MLALTYRPTQWADFAGNAQAIRETRAIVESPEFGQKGAAFWIQGPTGTGKTTLAGIIANAVGVNDLDWQTLKGADIGVNEAKRLARNTWLCPMAGNWKVYQIDEAHGMSAEAVGALLPALENLPPRVVVIFTTTVEESALPWRDDNGAIVGRCNEVYLSGVSSADGAKRLLAIAKLEGLELTTAQAVEFVSRYDGNMRRAVSQLDKLKAGIKAPSPSTQMSQSELSRILGNPPAVKTRGKAPARSAFDEFMSL